MINLIAIVVVAAAFIATPFVSAQSQAPSTAQSLAPSTDATLSSAESLVPTGVPIAITPRSALDKISSDSRFTILMNALVATGMIAELAGDGPYTVFAPTNDAFAAIQDVVDELTVNELEYILQYHIANGRYFGQDGLSFTTLNGEAVKMAFTQTGIKVNRAHVLLTSTTIDGVMYMIDQVLVPPSIALPSNTPEPIPGFLSAQSLAPSSLQSLAPSAADSSFDSLIPFSAESLAPSSVDLTFDSLVPSAAESLAPSAADLTFDSLVPSSAESLELSGVPIAITPRSALDKISSDSRFTTLMNALVATGMIAELAGDGPYTVFAPTNDAFAAIQDVADGLTVNELEYILQYHIANGKYYAQDGLSITTLNGEEVKMEFTQTGIKVNSASVLLTNTPIDGVMYMIDQVLIPPSIALPSSTQEPFPGFLTVEKITHASWGGCLEVDGDGSDDDAVKLGACSDTKTSQEFTYDGTYIHPGGDESRCLQAGRSGAIQSGMFMRVYGCDPTNIFQKFSWDPTGFGGGPMKLTGEWDGFCVVFRGDAGNDDDDTIIVNRCDAVFPESNRNWKIFA